ncbi:hypothetical protein SacmaDRAFT_4158 [Saccharomonospora marina XMU15]|uniref:Uncharacterized protein n=1 Tax=Saccharomonospora marina XMU15 TaxID=882083 RepID=H5X5Z7_9PSEU|nr:hypothetical protein [Saccharomonospora marina]EHR52351.1 hypothetical protein SacmaDRAFT_4158 [Saccharomonospora marina XMU15]
MNQHTDHEPLAEARAEADRNRARADAAEGLAALRAASLAELAAYAEELRCQVADLTDDAHTLFKATPYPPDGLRYVTARMNRLADTMARAAAGYTGARAKDMAYPRILDDLAAHGWAARPDHELDGTLPPIPSAELGERRGYRRGWVRDGHTLTLWFTGPHALAYADSSERGRLFETTEVRAVITGESGATDRAPVTPGQPLDASYAQVAEFLHAMGWTGPADTYACDEHGIRCTTGPGVHATWTRPSNPQVELSVWGIGDEPAHARYWAGPITSLVQLARITRHR